MTNKKGEKLGLYTTIAFVIANMIGVGVFTSLGFQLDGISNSVSIIALWIVGGVIALCGSLVYSELGTVMPRSGGEYHYLTQIYHPALGFLSGWVSLTVGFAAPVAMASMALGTYTNQVFPILSPQVIAISVIVFITIIHSYDVRFGGNFQNIFTSFKLLLIIVFIGCGFLLTPQLQNFSSHIANFKFSDIFNSSFAVSLVYVSLAYSGWNASAYIASEIKNPQRTIPRSLFISTLIVTVLYVLLNITFLITTPMAEMVNKEEIGLISAIHIFGTTGGNIMGMLISILLISTISSMIFVGPRVSQVMGEDIHLLSSLAYKSKHNTPVIAIVLQSVISILLIITSSFKSIFTYTGFTLSLFTFLTVFGLFVHRFRYRDCERSYKTWGYPVIPIIFLVITLWTIFYTFIEQPKESTLGLITVFSGFIIFLANRIFFKNKNIKK
jgi:APA family basic amino acid/polyamine antiporter